MDNILKELWYGNVSPFEDFYPNTKEMQKLSGLIARDHDELAERLPEKEGGIFSRLNQNILELEDLSNEALFAYAFSLGFRMATEIFADKGRER